ncbi:hypothetical protein BN2476_210157 [Paraburkholderia piptadeniae]|uniref:Uncharacterized protein n=1 Tax=Paraburkholderia piptadeniae TaxID=1701573 RepID=A0A1N7RW63_9BURK|nr:hypothetical protein [Paraburkholderia piptadeniae]SIT39355.1 hypothetical protein BN2476_210157 [Paraburkholderia piptadeniae]
MATYPDKHAQTHAGRLAVAESDLIRLDDRNIALGPLQQPKPATRQVLRDTRSFQTERIEVESRNQTFVKASKLLLVKTASSLFCSTF